MSYSFFEVSSTFETLGIVKESTLLKGVADHFPGYMSLRPVPFSSRGLRHGFFSDRTSPVQRPVKCFLGQPPTGAKPNHFFQLLESAKMSGFMEILLILAIVLAIFLLPRLLSRQPESEIQRSDGGLRLTGWKRLAITASLLWPVLLALYLKPWNNHWHIFLYVAVGPVVLAWGISWVVSGFRKERK